ncbi:hypothetical protein CFK37_07690 [Virgibacillus phasianinus]|uniref:Uncharacterized protein n=1 Tax=Virgibacillus phasianinus TaxID=2017483 RepID=A0A220U1S0_9BACI|nr:hypothetical protein CFK37_07690 [Virgibacillus phasianinus]
MSCGSRSLDETPENIIKKSQLKPSFTDNVGIPLAKTRKLINYPRKTQYFSATTTGVIIFNYVTIYEQFAIRFKKQPREISELIQILIKEFGIIVRISQ